MYGVDASRYEEDAAKKLYIRRIYDMIPSQMENKKKRIVAKDILDRKGDRFSNYVEEFEYLINSGITIPSHAISNPKYPLAESRQKNLLKLYMNDVGMLTSQLYHYNIQPILNDIASINLGSVYESAVAQELKAHYEKLFYYDNKQKGEVDFLVDDNGTMSVLLIEVKSGKDYTVHSALDNLMSICFIYCPFKRKGNKDKRKYPLSPDLLCYVPGEQGAGRRKFVLLGLMRIEVYKIIPSLSFDFTLIGTYMCSLTKPRK